MLSAATAPREKLRYSPRGLYLASVSCLLGFVTNRLNVSVTGFETWVGHYYVPKWTEFMITLSIIAAGFALFGVAVKYLPIFRQILSAKSTARFFQLDRRVQMMIDLQLASAIPLVQP